MEEKELTEKESLQIITTMIARTKQRYIGDGNIMLMWGYVCLSVTALVWIMLLLTQNPVWNWQWFLIWIVGGTLTPRMERKRLTSIGAKSYSDKLISQIWTVVGFCSLGLTVCCLTFMLFHAYDAWSSWLAFALIIVPFAEIAEGIIIHEKSLVAGGALGMGCGLVTICCIAGRIPLYVNWFLPMFMFAFICMMIIPGHILNHKAKLQ